MLRTPLNQPIYQDIFRRNLKEYVQKVYEYSLEVLSDDKLEEKDESDKEDDDKLEEENSLYSLENYSEDETSEDI